MTNILQFASQKSLAFRKYLLHLQIYFLTWEKTGILYQGSHQADIVPGLFYAYKLCADLNVCGGTELFSSAEQIQVNVSAFPLNIRLNKFPQDDPPQHLWSYQGMLSVVAPDFKYLKFIHLFRSLNCRGNWQQIFQINNTT